MSSIFGLWSSYMLEYCWLFALLLRSARYFTGVEGKWTPLPPMLPPSSELSLLFKGHSVAYLPVELQLNTLHMTSYDVSHMRLHQLDFLKKLITEKYIGFPEELCNSFQGLKAKFNYVCKCICPILCVFTFFYHPHFVSFFFLFLLLHFSLNLTNYSDQINRV